VGPGRGDRGRAPLRLKAIWEFRYPPEVLAEGMDVVEAIWDDMRSYAGYLSHVIVEDVEDPGHILVVSEWTSSEDADRVRDEYAENPNRVRADELVSEPRRRIVAKRVA